MKATANPRYFTALHYDNSELINLINKYVTNDACDDARFMQEFCDYSASCSVTPVVNTYLFDTAIRFNRAEIIKPLLQSRVLSNHTLANGIRSAMGRKYIVILEILLTYIDVFVVDELRDMVKYSLDGSYGVEVATAFQKSANVRGGAYAVHSKYSNRDLVNEIKAALE